MNSWSQLSLQKIFNKYEPIQQQKYRPTIFKQKKNKFQQIYNPILPQIDIFQSECPCQNKLTECERLKQILKESKIQKAEQIYQCLKLQKTQDNKYPLNVLKNEHLQVNNVLKSHFHNLQLILKVKQPTPLIKILKHAKSQYLTFWIYGLFCANWPKKQDYLKNIMYLIKKHNLDLNFDISHYQNNFQDQNDQFLESYTQKLSNLYKDQNCYITILRLICSKKVQMIVQKLLVCMLMKGRTRSQKQAINSALQL